MAENNNITQQKKKNSFRDMMLIIFVVLICFGLTVYGIVYLTGKIFSTEERQMPAQVLPKEAISNPEDGDVLTFSGKKDETGAKVAEPVADANNGEGFDRKAINEQRIPPPAVESNEPVRSVAAPSADNKPKAQAQQSQPMQKEATAKKEEKQPAKVATEAAPKKQAAEVKKGKYAVQIMALKSLDDAQKQALKVRSACPDVFIQKADLGDKGTWYRVRCGVTDSKKEAEETSKKLEKNFGAKPQIVSNN